MVNITQVDGTINENCPGYIKYQSSLNIISNLPSMIPQDSGYEYDDACNYLTALIYCGDAENRKFTFQTFSDNPNLANKGELTRIIHGTLRHNWEELVELNKKGAGVFVTVQETDFLGRKQENITGIRAFYCDHDVKLPSDYHLKPSLVIETSQGKGHSYWILKEMEAADNIRFKEIQERLISHYESDVACKDLPRVLRLPGLFHMKGEPQLVKIISQKSNRYTVEQILQDLDPLPALVNKPIISIAPILQHKDNSFEKLLNQGLSEVGAALNGSRNSTLNKVAYTLAGKAGELKDASLLVSITQELTHVAKLVGLEDAEIQATIKSGIDAGFNNPLTSPGSTPSKLEVQDKGKSKRSTKVELMMEAVEKLNLQWDVMTEEVVIEGKEVSLNELWLKLCLDNREDFSFEPLVRLIETQAQKNPLNRVQKYLENLPHNSNPEISLTKLYAAMGVNDELHQLFIRKWLIGAVARAMQPGCQMDNALILYSQKQGLYKTSFFRELFSGYFQTVGHHKSETDELLALYRKWCAEHGEIEYAINQKDVSRLKAFLTQTEDTFRSPYDRKSATRKRSFVICGTTNKTHFLNDPTGNRRFWVVTIESKIDINVIKSLRNEVWAAILALYKSGEAWYLDEKNDELARQETENYQQEHPWLETISNYLNRHNPCTIPDIMIGALGFDISRLNKKDQNEIAAILTELGCTKKRITAPGGKKPYYWHLPDAK